MIGNKINFNVRKIDFIKSNENLSKAIRKDNVLFGIIDQYTGEEITLLKITETPIVDGIIYFQLGSEYFKRVIADNIVHLKWFGVIENTDFTTVIQTAVNLCAGKYTLYIDGSYLINVSALNSAGVMLPSNSKLVMSENTIITQVATNKAAFSIFAILNNKTNISIKGGKIIGDRDIHIGTAGAGGHGVFIGDKCSEVLLEDMYISNMWGDGIVAAAYSLTDDASDNIIINNVICDNNRRQGISIVSAKNVKITNSIFKNTNGAAPSAGIDIEPNQGNYCRDIIIDNCLFDNNQDGLVMVGNHATSRINNVVVTNCIMQNSNSSEILIGSAGFTENITIENIQITQKASATGRAIWTSTSKNILLKNIEIIANGASTEVVAKTYGENIVFDNLKITSLTKKNGISGFLTSSNVTIKNCNINVDYNAINFVLSNAIINNNIKVLDNILFSNGLEGSKAISMAYCENVTIKGNKILSSGYSAIDLSNSTYGVVSDNYIIDAGGFRVGVDSCIRIDKVDNFIITNNSMKLGNLYVNKVGSAIQISPSGAGFCNNNIISQNNLVDAFPVKILNYSTQKNIITDWSIDEYFTKNAVTGNYTASGSEFQLYIPITEHKTSLFPNITVYETNKKVIPFSEVVDASGNITLLFTSNIARKIIIKN